MKKHIIFLIYIFAVFTACTKEPVRVVCIGDSITEGAIITKQSKYSYPVVLDSLLGQNYTVLNCGKSSTALQKKSDFPYWNAKEFSNVFAFRPNIVLIKLGTNDTKSQNWNAGAFEKDYQSLIDTLKSLPTSPRIILCLPVPVFQSHWGINDSTLVNGVIPIIERMADKNHLQQINLYQTMKNEQSYFPDGIHPNEEGSKKIALYIANSILEK